MKPTYLPNADYQALVARLLAARDTIDPENEVKVLLGDLASVWPTSLLNDREAEPGVVA